MFPDQTITLSFPNEPNCPDHETTWASFVEHNEADVVADVLDQLVDYQHSGHATIGGGAEPLVWIFA